ncbi:MAG: EamA family transporter [Gammaproteobacteria bacterium]|nr:EamA family transporter [Gammaproteobacteria bacterium]
MILGGALLWGTTGTVQAFAPAGFDPLVIGSLRLLIGGLALLLLALQQQEIVRIRLGNPLAFFLAALFIAGYQLCFFTAVFKTGVAIGTAIGIGSAPVAGGLLGFLFRGERLGRHWLLATLLAIGGCTLLCLADGMVRADLLGILLAVGAGTCYAAFTLVLKGLLQQNSSLSVVTMVFCLGALILFPLLLTSDIDWVLQPRAIAIVLYLGIVATAVPYLLFARGLKNVRISSATTLSLAEPLTAATLGLLLLNEQLELQAGSGIILIFIGLAVLIRAAPNTTLQAH